MDELIANGMWISQRFYLEVLAIALEKQHDLLAKIQGTGRFLLVTSKFVENK